MQPGRERQLVTAGVLLGIALSAVEATAVSAGMPTAVGELGGVERYSWVFSAYLLTSTVTVPLFGKLADLYGRRRVYVISVALFLLGSALCGLATSLEALVMFRALQGLGAGGLIPITATLAADIYSIEERARMQGLFASVWVVAGLLGPVTGGGIATHMSWRWIFYLGIPFGVLSAWLVHRYLRERVERRHHVLDLAGTVSLSAAVCLLLYAISETGPARGWSAPLTVGLLAASVFSLGLFLRQEHSAPEPMLPLDLFRNRIIAVGSLGNALLGMLLFGLITYIPIYGQGVLGGTPLDAGLLLIPLSLGWTSASTLGGRLLSTVSYRALLIVGGLCCAGGAALLWWLDGRTGVLWSTTVIGAGMGFVSLPYLLAVQNAVGWEQRGVATGTVQFFRSIGGALAVAALGALFNARSAPLTAGLDADAALDPTARAALDPGVLERLQMALQVGLEGVFAALLGMAILLMCLAFTFPRGSAQALAHPEKAKL